MTPDPDLYARAHRYPIEAPLRFRREQEIPWQHGVTENISRSGVLFRSSTLPDAGSRLEMILTLPVEVLRRPASEILLWGEVVRTVLHGLVGPQHAVAVRIRDYGFSRSSETEGQEPRGPDAAD